MNAHTLLYVIAFICFVVGVIDHPQVRGVRCIALGLAMLTLALIIGAR